jgi:hypothetical protein
VDGRQGAPGAERLNGLIKRLNGLIRGGKDPAADRAAEKAAPAFATFAARYMLEYAEPMKKPRTRAEDARLLKLHLLPRFST